MFPLEIFPERGLSESVITTVWVGVFVVAYFNLRLGWTFSGLVVPGYVVPLMLAKPISAGVIFVEAVLTYFVVRIVSNRFQNSGVWSSFFGRDRFFALVVASLLVRLILDGWVLPGVGEFVTQQLHLSFDYRNNLSSFGLIIVALVANQFWKTGFLRGMIPFTVTVGLTFLIVRYGLIELTNFNIGNLEYMYENISASLVASPKAYIILLSCAFVASRVNLLYGWDFNGILIPSLLALEWYHPHRIAMTFLESFVILGGSVLVLKLPFFRKMTVEGARKLLLFFNVAFAYKLAVGHIQQFFGLDFEATSLYGYGYLISTLIAVKMHDKHIPLRLTRSTLQASLTGAIVAAVVGFSLTFLPHVGRGEMPPIDGSLAEEPGSENRSLEEALRADKLALYQKRGARNFSVPLAHEVDSFVRSLRSIDRYVRTEKTEFLQVAKFELDAIGYDLRVVERRYLYLREAGEPRGWGIYVFDLTRPRGSVIEVPVPVDEWSVLESGSLLFDVFEARALAIGGSARRASRDGSADVLRSGRTLYSAFHRIVGQRSVLQVRGYTRGAMEALTERLTGESSSEEPKSILWVRSKLPLGVDLRALRGLIGPYRVEWGKTPYPNLQREETSGAFAELVLSRTDRKKLLSLSVIEEHRRGVGAEVVHERGYLAGWLLRRAGKIASRGSNRFVVPRLEELLLFDEEIIGPIQRLVAQVREQRETTQEFLDELRVAAASASIFDYCLVVYFDVASDSKFLILEESPGDRPRRYWGTYVFRLGESRPFCVEVPRPGLEMNSLEYGVALFDRLQAECVLLAGSHPWANKNGSADVVRTGNRVNLFSLTHQAVLRESGDRNLLVVQARAFGSRDGMSLPPEDVLVALADGCTRSACLTELAAELYESLATDDVTRRIVSGDPLTAGYEAYGTHHAHYARISPNKEFCVLWLSPFFRNSYMQESGESLQASQFDVAAVNTVTVDLFDYLLGMERLPAMAVCPGEVVGAVNEYLRTRDTVALVNLTTHKRLSGLERLIDVNTQRAFLLVFLDEITYPVVFNLGLHARGSEVLVREGDFRREAITRFIRARKNRLEIITD